MGRPDESLEKYRSALDVERRAPSALARNLIFAAGRLAVVEADLGISRGKPIPDYRRLAEIGASTLPRESFARSALLEFGPRFDFVVALTAGDFHFVREAAPAAIRRIEAQRPNDENEARIRYDELERFHRYLAIALYNLKEYAAAEREIQLAIDNRRRLPTHLMIDKLDASYERVLLALTVARQGRNAEALKIVEPELKWHRELVSRGSEDLYFQRTLLARAQLAAALASPDKAPALLAEAAAIMDGLPKTMTRLKTIALLRSSIAEEMKARPLPPSSPVTGTPFPHGRAS